LKKRDGHGIAAWKYVHKRPILWPECKCHMGENPDFILMEDNAGCHDCWYTNSEREKEGIPNVDWLSNSPDFNPIEQIWYLMKSHIQRRLIQ
jgi:hypothetical protein